MKQEVCMGNVKWDQLLVAFKGGHLERDLLKKMHLPHMGLEAWRCPRFNDMGCLATVGSCGYHEQACHHFARVKCYHWYGLD